jgi:hypothetical protein
MIKKINNKYSLQELYNNLVLLLLFYSADVIIY